MTETYTRDSDGKKFTVKRVKRELSPGSNNIATIVIETDIFEPIDENPMPAWKQIVWAPDYEVSSDGQVRKKTFSGIKILTPYIKTYPTIYIANGSKKGKIYLIHRLMWEAFNGPIPEGYQIDHIDRDKQNNKLSNLRLATASENRCNQIPTRLPKSGYRGVYPNYNRFQAMIRDQTGKRTHLGSFKTAREAAAAYNAAAIIIHGEFAILNQLENLGG